MISIEGIHDTILHQIQAILVSSGGAWTTSEFYHVPECENLNTITIHDMGDASFEYSGFGVKFVRFDGVCYLTVTFNDNEFYSVTIR